MKNFIMQVVMAGSGTVLLFSGIAAAAAAPDPRNTDRENAAYSRGITRAQADDRAAEAFAAFDVNHDGKIDASDIAIAEAKQRDARFDRLDTNKDGEISRAEYDAAAQPHARTMRTGFERVFGSAFQPRHAGGMVALSRFVGTDKDAPITKAQFMAAVDKRFEKMDVDHDGKLTRADWQATRAARHANIDS
ncbi:EF-hand domain-containing protein [Novosphingobium sp. Rr 2-17]|uniref:EF-hand domain-containing protein n=1 Tax=Novosphingobium sp. Rr 2-17 TaxID=555793 RepID=UPI0012F67BB2|nr:EF-hand domain-containing protein [Novosphingobium sp. Rr 2-17]